MRPFILPAVLPVVLLAFAASLGPASVQAAPKAGATPRLTGMWVIETDRLPRLDLDAMRPTPAALARVRARETEIAAGYTRSESHVRCLPAGMPQMMTAPFGIQIGELPDRMLILAEVSNLPRTVFYRKDHPAQVDPSWNGNSIGRWEGRTLVIDTVGFNDADAYLFNFTPPVKRTPTLHVVERLHLENGGGRLIDDMTLTDPATFAAPVTVRYSYRRLGPGEGLIEYVCEPDVDAIRAFDAYRAAQHK